MKPLLALFVFGTFAFGSSIPVTGTGTFFLDNFGDNYATACFGGSDGTNSVGLCDFAIPTGGGAPWGQTSLAGGNTPPNNFGAVVDGQSGVYWYFQLGADVDNFVTLKDASGNALVTQPIQGYIQITSDIQQGGPRLFANGQRNDEWQESGTFLIVSTPTPEPSSGILLALGICCVVLIERRKRKADASTPL